MAWNIPTAKQRTYSRNALGTVVAQLRFDPVLKMPGFKDEFQDLIRRDFPTFEERVVSSLAINPQTDTVLRGEERSFGFKDIAGTSAISLANDSLALETSTYEHHESFLGSFENAVNALLQVCSHLQPTRLGLRYINVLRREIIGADLKRDVEWQELVSETLLAVPGPAGIDDSAYKAEITAPIDPGTMTLRHGLARQEAKPTEYRIDIDRYLVERFDVKRTPELLTRFSDDCFGLFQFCIEAGLEEWMEPETPQGEVADA